MNDLPDITANFAKLCNLLTPTEVTDTTFNNEIDTSLPSGPSQIFTEHGIYEIGTYSRGSILGEREMRISFTVVHNFLLLL